MAYRMRLADAVSGLRAAHAANSEAMDLPFDMNEVMMSVHEDMAREQQQYPDMQSMYADDGFVMPRMGPPRGRRPHRETQPRNRSRSRTRPRQAEGEAAAEDAPDAIDEAFEADSEAEEDEAPRARNRRRRPRRGAPVAGAGAEAEEAPQNGGDGYVLLKDTRAHPAPSLVRLRAYLGEPNQDPTKCWMCRAARTNSAAISFQRWNEMVDMYRRHTIDTEPVALAMELAKFFEEKIRQPANKLRGREETQIPKLPAVDIYWHCREHIIEASNRVVQRIRELQEIGDTIQKNCLYKPVRNVNGEMILVPRKKMLDAYTKVTKEERAWRNCRPDRQVMFSQDYQINISDIRGWANVRRPYFLTNLPAVALDARDKSK